MIRMQVPAPQWLQQTPQGISYAQPAGAAVFTNALRPNPLEGLSQQNPCHGMAGRAGDTGLLALAPVSKTSVVQNNVDPAWQRSIEIDPTVGPQAGPMMLFDAGMAQGEQMSVASPRWVIQTSPTGQKTAMMVSPSASPGASGVPRNMAQSTSSGTSATRINTNPLTEPPIASQAPPPKPAQNTTPSGDGWDGGGVNYTSDGGMFPDVVDGGSAIAQEMARQAKAKEAAFYAAMAAEEARRRAAAPAPVATSSNTLLPILIAGGAIAALAWWASKGSASEGSKGA